MKPKMPSSAALILILGTLTALSPFSIDMYLPAFQGIAENLKTSVPEVALSLSSYFIGLALGQLFYGPFLDRYGRRQPLLLGLGIYILASFGCMLSPNIETLIAFRFLQALGGCAANVASVAMVRDFFSVRESAKIFSLLMLILGVSPLIAPTVGGYIATAFGWQAVFATLIVIGALMMAVTYFKLPEGHKPDPSITLKVKPILKNFLAILKEPQFYTFTFAGAFAFSGLFVYIAGSPILFMDIFKVSAQTYGWIFAGLAVGFIGASQINILLLKKFRNDQILRFSLISQTVAGLVFLIGTTNGWFDLAGTILMFFWYLSSVGMVNPNAAALALAPFSRNAGSASALMGALQMGIGALASSTVGLLTTSHRVLIITALASSAVIAISVLFLGQRKIGSVVVGDSDGTVLSH